jgi:hypothetical protein
MFSIPCGGNSEQRDQRQLDWEKQEGQMSKANLGSHSGIGCGAGRFDRKPEYFGWNDGLLRAQISLS